MVRRKDDKTLNLFSVPSASTLPGTLNINLQLCHLLMLAIKESGMERDEIALHMSRLTGEHITDTMIDAWTAKSKTKWRFPLQYLPAFEVATSTHLVSNFIADQCGGTFLAGDEVLKARLGSKLTQQKQLNEEIRDLKKHIGELS